VREPCTTYTSSRLDYDSFGMLTVGRTRVAGSQYRYGFQNQEKDDEIKGSGNSINYKYRMHDPRLGRFLSIDPMYKEYPFYSPYAFSGNRVIDAVELEGLQPGILFGTPDAAATNYGTFYGDNSLRANQEYGSTIYKVVNSKGVAQYAYSTANIGTTGETVSVSSAPKGTTPVADIHTHAAYTFGKYLDNVFSGAHPTSAANLSETSYDIGDNNRTGLAGYLVTPNGSLQKYDPSTGNISTVNNNNPSDVNDPLRLNTVSSAATATSYTIKSGDTLNSLAKRFDTTVSAISTENKISDPNKIQAGSTLTITN